MSAKDVWETPIRRHCIYESNMYTCKIPFSIRYDGLTYEVKEDYRLQLDEDEYLEIAEITGPEEGAGFWKGLGQIVLSSLNRKRILWRTITSVD